MRSKKSAKNELSIRAIKVISESPANIPIIRETFELLRNEIEPIELKLEESMPIDDVSNIDDLLEEFVEQRLTDSSSRNSRAYDSIALRDFERRVLTGNARARGIPYEGEGLRKLYQKLLANVIDTPTETCVILTDRLPMTWSEDERRYHARAVVFGIPNIISISGLIEAPARPREYYLAKQTLTSMGLAYDAQKLLSEQFEGSYLDADDERFPKVLRGYLLQCLFYAYDLEPFCDNIDCMLYNAHWQEEMIHAQVESGRLCTMHESRLREIIEGSDVRWLMDR